MENFKWQHIQFADGSNPYICKTEKDFKWILKRYMLVNVRDGFWKVLGTIPCYVQ